MVQFAALLLRGVIATLGGLLIAGGTLTLAADRATVQRPTLVPVPAAPATLKVPLVSGQAYVFAKGILQDHGFAWHVTGRVQGYAANTVSSQQPTAGTTVLDTGAPTITLTLARNPSYVERGTPENDAPYTGTAIRLPANVAPRLEPVPVPVSGGFRGGPH
jgi:beta-lactam-binding protein with PASTA domain